MIGDDLSKKEKIKKLLSRFTDDFSDADIEFIRDLRYPCNIKIKEENLFDPDYDGISQREIEDFKSLEENFKKIPLNCEIKIINDGLTMTLISREEE